MPEPVNRASEQSERREAEHCGVSELSGASDQVAFFKTRLSSLDPRNFLIQLSKMDGPKRVAICFNFY